MTLQRILVARTDRIGDLILSTPVLETLHHSVPEVEISVLVNPRTRNLVETCPYIKRIHLYDPAMSKKQRRELMGGLKEVSYDAVLVLFTDHGLASLLYRTGIPRRFGPASRLSSYLFFTDRLAQNRSRSYKSEAEYNLELLGLLGIPKSQWRRETRVWVTDEDRREASAYLRANQIQDGETFLLIHPGSGGSALNWPTTRYRRFLRDMLQMTSPQLKIALAAGPGEENIVQGMMIDMAGPLVRFFDIPSLRVYAAVLERARLLVASSTGPIHLAHAVGTPTLGFYSPIPVQRPERWGTFPEHTVLTAHQQTKSPSVLFIPEVECPVTHHCLGSTCSFSVEGRDCMGRILVDDVIRQAQWMLKQPSARTQPHIQA
jgi:ADP-heptose:LPS heptosyltransferase